MDATNAALWERAVSALFRLNALDPRTWADRADALDAMASAEESVAGSAFMASEARKHRATAREYREDAAAYAAK